VIRQRNKLRRGLAILAVVPASVGSLVRGLASRRGGRPWMMPLALFLCLTGLGLLLALGVEALAPFIYAIF
jgi:hypothetical protein